MAKGRKKRDAGDVSLPWLAQRPLPCGCGFKPKTRLRNLTRMASEQPEAWREEWRRIKQEQPALAEVLKDPLLHELRERFDGHILIEEGGHDGTRKRRR